MANQQLRDQVEDYKGRLHKNRRLKKISFAVALCLVAVTIVALVLPAVTLELGVAQCGKEEHAHTDACVTQQLVCAKPTTPGHVHTASCLNEAGAVACGKEAAGHMHLATCYDAQGRLVCGQEEDVHQHTAACIDANNTLACDTEEAAHVHGDTCYAVQDGAYVLVCQLPAAKGHVHSNVCLDAEDNVICGQEESLEVTHVHDDNCYTEEITCGLEEHTHTDLCYDEITQSIMKKDEESSAAEAADDAAEAEDVVISAEGDLTQDEIAEAKDQGLLYENDAMIVTFDVPEDIKDKVVLNVTETDEPVVEADPEFFDAGDSDGDTDASGQPVEGALPDPTASNGDDANIDAGSEGVAPGLDPASSDDAVVVSDEGDDATDDDAAYATNLHIEATLDGKPVDDIADLGITAKLQMKPSVIQPILAEFDGETIDPEIRSEVGAELTVIQTPAETQTYSISERSNGETLTTTITDVNSAATPEIEIVSNNVRTTTSSSANPEFTVQFYALVNQLATEKADEKDVVLPSIIDTSSTANNTDQAVRPINGTGADSINTALRSLVLQNIKGTNQYQVRTEEALVEMYQSEEGNKYVEKPNLNYFNKLQENGNYRIFEVWVLKKGADLNAANEVDYGNGKECRQYWDVYEGEETYRFTNREESAGTNYIYIYDGAVIRLVNKGSNEEKTNGASFYDYDIGDGTVKTSGSAQIMNTKRSGINSIANYANEGTPLGFGNTNAGTDIGKLQWIDSAGNANALNAANKTSNGVAKSSFKGCTFGLASSLNGGVIQYSSGVDAPNLFNEGDSEKTTLGKTQHDGTLTFDRVGDTYTLSTAAVDNSTSSEPKATNLNVFDVYSGVYSNNFWPMDDASTFGASGHDIKFGDPSQEKNRKFGTGAWDLLPRSDDGTDHNSYFGMRYEIDFELSADYMGPLEYLFFGDDDLWVFLDNQLVIDIGGIHGAVGQYVDLWDYLPQGTSGKHKLTVFYTERGASGSTCFMNYTLPSVSFPGSSRTTGSLEVSKAVDGKNDNPDEEFQFTINFFDNKGTLDDLTDDVASPDDYAYTRYDANGTPNLKELLVHDGATFGLKAGEKIVVSNLPINTRFDITEIDEEGRYITSSTFVDSSLESISGGKTISGNIKDSAQVSVKFKNTRAYELPATGGDGVYWYWLGGGALVVLAVVLWRRKAAAAAVAAGTGFMSTTAPTVTKNYVSPSGKPESSYEKSTYRNWGDDAHSRRGGR